MKRRASRQRGCRWPIYPNGFAIHNLIGREAEHLQSILACIFQPTSLGLRRDNRNRHGRNATIGATMVAIHFHLLARFFFFFLMGYIKTVYLGDTLAKNKTKTKEYIRRLRD